jgi:CheY-like chemotaxis protein
VVAVPGAATFMKAKILVVEDERGQREALAEVLSRLGYEVQCAANGSEALELMRHSESLPGLILLDLIMPVMDGWQFRAAQRKDRALADVPVVVLSALDDTAKKNVQDGAAAFLSKPLRWQALLPVVERFCGTTRPRPDV